MRGLCSAAGCLLTLMTVGCGGETPRYQLSGNVTFQGRPVAAGQIRFEPKADGGNIGPGTFAEIKNGRYQTPSGQGVIGGLHRVIVSGTDGVPFEMEGGVTNPQGKPLFNDYTTEVDFPKKNSEHHFVVPGS